MKPEDQVCQNLLDEKKICYGRRKGLHGRQPWKMMEIMRKQLG